MDETSFAATGNRAPVNQWAADPLTKSLRDQKLVFNRRWRWLRRADAMLHTPGTVLGFHSRAGLPFFRCGFAHRWLQQTIQWRTSKTRSRSNQSTSFNTSSSHTERNNHATLLGAKFSPLLGHNPRREFATVSSSFPKHLLSSISIRCPKLVSFCC